MGPMKGSAIQHVLPVAPPPSKVPAPTPDFISPSQAPERPGFTESSPDTPMLPARLDDTHPASHASTNSTRAGFPPVLNLCLHLRILEEVEVPDFAILQRPKMKKGGLQSQSLKPGD